MKNEECSLDQSPENNFFNDARRPTLLYAGQIMNDASWSCDIHTHNDYSEILYISEGEGFFTIGSTEYTGRRGDILIYNKQVVHHEFTNPKNPFKAYFCGIGNLSIKNIADGCLIPDNCVPLLPTGKYSSKIESYLSDIFQEVSYQIFGYDIICRGLLNSLILLIYRLISYDAQSKLPHSLTVSEKIREYINKNYTQNLSLSSIADVLYLSPNYMASLFKNEVGISPINYLINKRILEAKNLLLYTNKTLTEIAFLVGYENPSYFAAIFKKITGVSPSKFRNINTKNDIEKKDIYLNL